jgi:xylulokinase
VGTVVSEVRGEIGLNKDVIVVKGSMDQITSAIGAGNIKPGIVTETTGSALAVVVTADMFETDGSPALPYQVHALSGKYAILPYAQTAGIVYKWFKENVLTDEKESSDVLDFDALNSLAAAVGAGAEGLVFLPFLAGAHFPENDTLAKGVVYGITLKHNRSHFCRAIMESIGYMLRNILLHVEQSGIEVEEIHSMGGAARSDLWMQIKTDICNIPMVRMEEEETSTLGAAILASLQTHDFSSIEEAVAAMVKRGRRFEPAMKNIEVYDRMFALYTELYQNLKGTYREFNVG